MADLVDLVRNHVEQVTDGTQINCQGVREHLPRAIQEYVDSIPENKGIREIYFELKNDLKIVFHVISETEDTYAEVHDLAADMQIIFGRERDWCTDCWVYRPSEEPGGMIPWIDAIRIYPQ